MSRAIEKVQKPGIFLCRMLQTCEAHAVYIRVFVHSALARDECDRMCRRYLPPHPSESWRGRRGQRAAICALQSGCR